VLIVLLALAGLGVFRLVQQPGIVPARPAVESRALPADNLFIVPREARPTSVSELYAAAREVLDELTADFPQSPDAFHVLGRFEYSVDCQEAARQAWQICLRSSQDYVPAYEGLAKIAMDAGEHEQASATLADAAIRGCVSEELFEIRAKSLVELGRFDEAIEVLEDGLTQFPQSATNWLLLGQTQMQRRDFEGAEAALRQAVRLAPRSTDAHYALATACQRQSKNEEAAALRQRFVELKTVDYETHDQQLAVADVEHMRQKAAIAFCGAASCYYQNQDFLKAERLLVRATEIAPRFPESYRLLAPLFRNVGRLQDALTAQSWLSKIEPNNVVNYLNLASLASEHGDFPRAFSALEAAQRLEPDNPLVKRYLSQLTAPVEQPKPTH